MAAGPPPTYGATTRKIDYLFSDSTATQVCDVTDSPVQSSDHRPITDVIRMPAVTG
ncbi:hypothetical protein [Peterkaempfera sp. SMS 1(5)a]|uniref:hypothetical protein n=1 Tax=Peterkaempfera podocarpi TaxID=3232308 RepID=UPI00366C3120